MAATAGAGAVRVAAVVLAAVAVPSRMAFSSAAFCARSRLSASIFALTAARAFLSFSFSERDVRGQKEWGRRNETKRTAALCFEVL